MLAEPCRHTAASDVLAEDQLGMHPRTLRRALDRAHLECQLGLVTKALKDVRIDRGLCALHHDRRQPAGRQHGR